MTPPWSARWGAAGGSSPPFRPAPPPVLASASLRCTRRVGGGLSGDGRPAARAPGGGWRAGCAAGRTATGEGDGSVEDAARGRREWGRRPGALRRRWWREWSGSWSARQCAILWRGQSSVGLRGRSELVGDGPAAQQDKAAAEVAMCLRVAILPLLTLARQGVAMRQGRGRCLHQERSRLSCCYACRLTSETNREPNLNAASN